MNDARNKARVVDLGKMAKCACFEGDDADYSRMWLVDLAQTRLLKSSYRGRYHGCSLCM